MSWLLGLSCVQNCNAIPLVELKFASHFGKIQVGCLNCMFSKHDKCDTQWNMCNVELNYFAVLSEETKWAAVIARV